MSTCPDGCLRVCFYCDAPLSPRHEHDHVPPRRQGGDYAFPVCLNCHDLKDRVPLSHWSVELQMRALRECGPLGRLYLAKVFGIHGDGCELAARELVSDPSG